MQGRTIETIAGHVALSRECRARLRTIKAANEFAYIAEVPTADASFTSKKLENDYQFKHPVMTTLHPGVWGGAAAGAVLAGPARWSRLAGAMLGGTAGLTLEGLHRLGYLLHARGELERGKDPTDPRYRL